MNERIISEINLMSEEAMQIMINNFTQQVSEWCEANSKAVREESVEEVSAKL